MYKVEDIVKVFIKYLPEGLIWESKYDSKIYKNSFNGFKRGFVLHHMWYLFASVIQDLLIRMDTQLSDSSLESLEKSLGLPDDCIPLGETYEQKNTHIAIKQFLKKKCKNRADFIHIGNLLGFDDMDILNGSEYNIYPPYLVPFFPLPITKGQRDNIIFVRSDKIFDGQGSTPPLEVPFFPREKTLNFKILECILNKYKPINSKIIFIRKQ